MSKNNLQTQVPPKMTFAQVVETPVPNNSSFQSYPHLDNHTIQITDHTPGFKTFTNYRLWFNGLLVNLNIKLLQSYTQF